MSIKLELIPNHDIFLQALNVSKKYINDFPEEVSMRTMLVEIKSHPQSKDLFVEYDVILYEGFDISDNEDELVEREFIRCEILYKVIFAELFKDLNIKDSNYLGRMINYMVYPELRSLVDRLIYDMGISRAKIPLSFLGRDQDD